jgi:predicted RNA-binding Zn ribbon-like protein
MVGMELVGNAVCLDFVNTVNKRPDPDRDELADPDGLTTWAAAVGLEPHVPSEQDAAAGEAVELREAIYRTFAGIVADADPATVDIAVIMRWYGQAVTHALVRRHGTRCVLGWPSPSAHREILRVVAASAVRLLIDGPLDRIGECPSCGWLFVDTSRNGRRRWCSMATCGSRSKANRYFANKKRGSGSAAGDTASG